MSAAAGDRGGWWLAGFAWLAVGWKSVSAPLTDHFHEGEYLGALRQMADYRAGDAPFPLLTHGAMDHLPARLAAALHGQDQAIVATRSINVLLSGLGLWLLLWMSDELWRRAGVQRGLRLALAALLAATLFASAGDASALLQRILNPRELGLLMLMAVALRHAGSGAREGLVLAAVGGTVAASAPFWAYDRGLVALCAFAGFAAGLAWQARWRDAIAAALAFVATLAALDASRALGTIAENLANVSYWVGNATLWSLPLDLRTVLRALPLVALDAALLVALMPPARQAWREQDRATLVWLAMLTSTMLLLLRAAFNRPDSVHLFWAAWPALLGWAAAAAPLAREARLDWSVDLQPWARAPRALRSGTLLAALCILLWGIGRGPTAPLGGLLAPPPNSRVVLDRDLVASIAELRALDPGCALAWGNNGTVALLADLPFCGAVPYPAFIAPTREAQYLEALRAAPPGAILLDPEGWPARIDGRSMAERLPAVAAFIAAEYVERTRHGRWSLLVRGTPAVVATPTIGSNGALDQGGPR